MHRPTARTHLTLAATIALLVVVGACGSDGTTTDAGSEPATTTTTAAPATSAPTTAPTTTTTVPVPPGEVRIQDYEFLPPTISVSAGETVTWRNGDDVDHWVLTEDGTTVDSGAIEAGQTFTATLATPGSYPYFCDIHNAMTGTIVVS